MFTAEQPYPKAHVSHDIPLTEILCSAFIVRCSEFNVQRSALCVRHLAFSECQTTCPQDNSSQTTRPRSSDSVVDKRKKNDLFGSGYDVKSWVHIFSGSFGSVVDKRTRG